MYRNPAIPQVPNALTALSHVKTSVPLLRKKDPSDWPQVGKRAKQIREALDEGQEQFVQRLKSEARIATSVSEWSRIESGRTELPRHWMARIAALDPKHRGVAWLGHGEPPAGESVDSSPQRGGRTRRLALLPHEKQDDGKGQRGA